MPFRSSARKVRLHMTADHYHKSSRSYGVELNYEASNIHATSIVYRKIYIKCGNNATRTALHQMHTVEKLPCIPDLVMVVTIEVRLNITRALYWQPQSSSQPRLTTFWKTRLADRSQRPMKVLKICKFLQSRRSKLN